MRLIRVKSTRRAQKSPSKFLKGLRRNLFLFFLGLVLGLGIGFIGELLASTHKQDNIRELTAKSIESPNATSTNGPAQTNPNFSLYPSWSQDFANDSSGSLNKKYWNVDLGPAQNGNNEKEYYTDSSANIHIKNGALSLVAIKQPEPQNYDYSSARIDTEGRVAFLYGRVDITAKLPNGVGTWPAAWFLPSNNKYEDLSPKSDNIRYLNGGEMDLIEEVGFQPNVEYGILHTLSDLSNPNGVGTYNTVTVANNNTQYNKYSLLWTPTKITFEINDQPFYSFTKAAGSDYTTWPFDQPFYLILNLAVGGSWGGENTAQYPNGINDAALPASIDISSINYYPYLKGESSNNHSSSRLTTQNKVVTHPQRAVVMPQNPKNNNVLKLLLKP